MRDTTDSAFEGGTRERTRPERPRGTFRCVGSQFLMESRVWKRILLLCFLLLLSVALYVVLIATAPQPGDNIMPFLLDWLICFLPYIMACIFVLATKPLTGRWFWVEMSILLFGALLFRLLLLPLPTGLSRDAWRYLWDARMIVHGYSPYAYAPGDKALLPLRNILFTNSRFRNTPTKYPPGAELFFVVGYWLSPTNLLGLKGLFIACDMVTCGALAWLLSMKGLDVRRVIIYAWCPLPIIEFAIEGHLDVLVVMFTVLAVLSATIVGTNGRRGLNALLPIRNAARERLVLRTHLIGEVVFIAPTASAEHSEAHFNPSTPLAGCIHQSSLSALTGFFIGMATLMKLYPILLLVVFFRGRNWILLLTCFVTIFLGYIPFFILGHGQVLSVLLSFTGQQQSFESVVQRVIEWNSSNLGLTTAAALRVADVIEVLIIGAVVLVVFILRLRRHIGIEAATLLLIGTILTCYSHLFPWYATALLPWIAVLARPLRIHGRFSGRGLAIAMAWYFTCIVILSYMLSQKAFDTLSDWSLYYKVSFGVVVIGLVVAALLAYRNHHIKIQE